ncbi:hypothetical protein PDIDSM_4272 [Penicillium digitatum]|nr:hypothetical protein PDIDSM_4272 [Penicillium digitatum]
MSNNRPFLANFLAAFRAQSTYKPTTQQVGTTSTLSSAQISQSARAIATKAANTAQGSSVSSTASAVAHHNHNHNHPNHRHTHTSSSPTSSATAAPASPVQSSSPAPSHHYHHDQSALPSTPPSSTSTPIPINHSSADRQRRGSDSSSGSGGSVMLSGLKSGILAAGHRLVKSAFIGLGWLRRVEGGLVGVDGWEY